MQSKKSSIGYSVGMAALWFALLSTAPAQGVTTSALTGVVTDKEGKPVAGATITVVHVESNTRAIGTTRANGQYDVSGLRVGGPYSITVSAKELSPETKSDVYLGLDQAGEVSFALGSEVVMMEALRVTEAKDVTFSSAQTSNNFQLTTEDIKATPTIRRDIQDLANVDSRLTLVPNTSTGEFQLSSPGQNYRYNSFLIDGVQANDPFGLNGNGFASLKSPVPLDAIQAFSIDLSPYDVRRSSFTGALINAVVRSGTNKVHGTAYYAFSNKDLRAENPLTKVKDTFDDRTFGFTVGGPIIKNKLFFFLAYDDFRRSAASPTSLFLPNQDQVNAIINASQSKYGYDAGSLSADGISYQKTYLAKLDWNISDMHRLGFTYRRTDGSSPIFADATSSSSLDINGNVSVSYTTSLSNHWYQQPRINDTYTAKLNSSWTPDFSTEATISYSKYDGTPQNNGSAFPEVLINGVPGINLNTGAAAIGSVRIGTERSRQLNEIYADIYYGSLVGEYTFGSHKLTFGADAERDDITNKFAQYVLGQYTFGSSSVNGVPAWSTGTTTVGSARQAFLYKDDKQSYTLDQAYALWALDNYGVFIQDAYRVNSQLSLNGGLRFDYPYTGDEPLLNPNFAAAAFTWDGEQITRNNTTNSGNYTIAPRLGFNYKFDTKRKTQLKGGAGIFQGRNPAVWLSNSYSNIGALGSSSVNASSAAPVTFTPTTSIQTGKAAQNINVTDPDFKQPVSVKGNLALDHELPWFGLIASVFADFNSVLEAPMPVNLNLGAPTSGPATLPDGRIRYGSKKDATKAVFGDVIYLTDTDRGYSQAYTFSVRRPMKDNWSATASYTRAFSKDVSPMSSSVAYSNWSGRTVFNPNEATLSNSNYSTPNKVVLSVAKRFHFFGKEAATTMSAVYRGLSGHSYSYVYYGDVNGDGFRGDLPYIPVTNDNMLADSKVVWASQADHDRFLAYAKADSLLSGYLESGGVLGRNASYNPWQNTIDLHFEQDIPIRGKTKVSLFADIMNFANMLDSDWGVVEGADFPYTRSLLDATFDATKNVYTYKFNQVSPNVIFTDLSRWQVQLGARVSF